MTLLMRGFPIRISPDQSSFPAPRSVSSVTTSFIGIWRQGIHRWLFVAWEFFLHCSLELSMLVLALKFSKGGRDQARV